MSYVTEKTNSSNITNEADSDFKFSNYYKTILNKNNKLTNTFIRKTSSLNSFKSSNIISLNKKERGINGYDNRDVKLEKNKNFIASKNFKKNRLNLLFKNLLIREKQKSFTKFMVQVNNYNIYIKQEPKKSQSIVNNNSSLFRTFLNQTRSNFNNKYRVIYSISDWRQKNKVKTLLNSIKQNQYKNNFSDYLRMKLLKRCSSTKMRLKTIDNKKKNNKEKEESNQARLINNIHNEFLKNILHKNNLIKIKTINDIKNKTKPNQLRKSCTDIFYTNNTLFKTMPVSKLKIKKRKSFE